MGAHLFSAHMGCSVTFRSSEHLSLWQKMANLRFIYFHSDTNLFFLVNYESIKMHNSLGKKTMWPLAASGTINEIQIDSLFALVCRQMAM